MRLCTALEKRIPLVRRLASLTEASSLEPVWPMKTTQDQLAFPLCVAGTNSNRADSRTLTTLTGTFLPLREGARKVSKPDPAETQIFERAGMVA